jgi:hypothetical protein
METDRTWYRELSTLVESKPETLDRLKEKISLKTINHYLRGGVNIDKINIGTRAFLYKVTGIESFNFDGCVDPEIIDINKVISGEQPRDYLKIWLGYNGKNFVSLAKEAKVHQDTVRKFANKDNMRQEFKDKIIATLKKYAGKNHVAVQVPVATPQPNIERERNNQLKINLTI